MRAQGAGRLISTMAGLGLVAAFAFAPGVARASGGGGCGQPVTDEAGGGVEIQSFCFTPTILRVEVGQAVTFANGDRTPHTVLGANAAWGGYDTLKKGHDIAYRFTQAGVYPYVCTYHIGMVGVIVVGDGIGGAIDTTTSKGPVIRVPSTELQHASTVPPAGGNGVWTLVAVIAVGLVLIGGATLVQRRRGHAAP